MTFQTTSQSGENKEERLNFLLLDHGGRFMISVACYQDKYQVNLDQTDQLLHNSLGKECPVVFWHHLRRLAVPSAAFCIK